MYSSDEVGARLGTNRFSVIRLARSLGIEPRKFGHAFVFNDEDIVKIAAALAERRANDRRAVAQ